MTIGFRLCGAIVWTQSSPKNNHDPPCVTGHHMRQGCIKGGHEMNTYNITMIDRRGLPTSHSFSQYEEASAIFHRAVASGRNLYVAFVRFDPISGESEALNQFCEGATFA